MNGVWKNRSEDTVQVSRPSSFISELEFARFVNLKWFTTKQAALYLGTTPGGVRNRLYRGQLKAYKPFGKSGVSYFKKSELDRLIEVSKNKGD